MANQPVLADDAAGVAADRVGRVGGRIGLWMLAATVASALVTCALVAVERALAHRRDVAVDESTAAIVKSDVDTAVVAKKPSKTVFFAMALLAVLAFQVHVFIDSAPLYRAHAPATLLPMLTPVFWIGFNVAMLSLVVGRRPAALTTVAPTLPWLIAAQRRRADRAPDRATRIGVSAHGADTRLHLAGNGPTLDGGGFRRARAPLRFMMAPSRPRSQPPPPRRRSSFASGRHRRRVSRSCRPRGRATSGRRGTGTGATTATSGSTARGCASVAATSTRSRRGSRKAIVGASGRARGDTATATVTACRTATTAIPTTRVAPDRRSSVAQNPEPGSFRNSISSAVDWRPRITLRCGNRPKRSITARWRCA